MSSPDIPTTGSADSPPQEQKKKGGDFMALMNTDIRQLEIRKSLRRLGDVRVIEWDFKTVMPKVHEFAYQEVDVVGLFRKIVRIHGEDSHVGAQWSGEDLEQIGNRLQGFLEFIAGQLLEQPGHARIGFVQEPPNRLRYDMVLVKRDAAALIGTGGHTATAIRNVMRAAAERAGVQVQLRILSHEEAAARAVYL